MSANSLFFLTHGVIVGTLTLIGNIMMPKHNCLYPPLLFAGSAMFAATPIAPFLMVGGYISQCIYFGTDD